MAQVPDRKTIKTAFVKWLLASGLFVLGNVSGNVWMLRLTDALPELRFEEIKLLQGVARFPHHPTAATASNPLGTASPLGSYLLTLPFSQPVRLKFVAQTGGGPVEFDGGRDIQSTWQIPLTWMPYYQWRDLGLAGIEKLGLTSFKMEVTPADESEPIIWEWEGGVWVVGDTKDQ